MNALKKIVLNFSSRARTKRIAVFRESFEISKGTKILDLGSENGSNIASYLAGSEHSTSNIYIADIDRAAVADGNHRFGFTPVFIDETDRLDFPDGFFDVVFCSSVIEHVTISKSDIWNCVDGERFRSMSWERQQSFANEIARLGRQYFVQTPSRWFPIESHSWLPFMGYLPRKALILTLKLSNRVWIKKTYPDFNLLSKRQMQELFPDSEIRIEKVWGLEKSIIAIKSSKVGTTEPH